MPAKQVLFIVINLIGGALVIGSYIYVFKTQPQAQTALWGGVPISSRSLYTLSMLLSAFSYFIFSSYILLRVSPSESTAGNISAYILFSIFYLMILLPSSVWTPFTLAFIANQRPIIWFLIRTVLFLVALGSLGVLITLLFLNPKPSGTFYWSAVAGITIFFLHTGVLDALLWPYFYKI